MFRTMALKEWRETRGIALLGLGAYAVMLWFAIVNIVKWNPHRLPLLEDNFLPQYIFVSAAMGMALGMRQSLGESILGTFPFLLHRPARRGWLIGMKLAVGLIVYLTVGLLPIWFYGFYMSAPGVHASPYSWEMTMPSLAAWSAMTMLYFSAFLSSIRPGRWFGSRLFPLFGAGMLAVFTIPTYLFFGMAASVMMHLVYDASLVVSIFYITRIRDYA